MGTLSPENLCAHRKGAIEELIKGRAREMAAQQQLLFGKPTGDHDGPEESLVKQLTSFTESLFSHVLMSSCEDFEVRQIPNEVRSLIGDQRAVDPGKISKRPAAKDLSGCGKRGDFRCTQKFDQGCQAAKRVGHHTPRSYSLNKPSQNPSHLLSFSSKTITTQDSESYCLGFSSKTISTQYTSSCPSPVSSVRNEYGEETVQRNGLSGDLPDCEARLLLSTRPLALSSHSLSCSRRQIERPNAQDLKIQDDLVHFRKDFEGGVSAENLDVRIQEALGHFREDFERGVSAENLGAKFGGYGSFVSTYKTSPVWNHPGIPAKGHSSNAPTHLPKQSTPGGAKKVCDADAPSPARRDSSHPATNFVKEAKDLKYLADRLKNSGSSAESTGLYFQAALKFLHGASLLESTNGESVKLRCMIQSIELYVSTAKLCEFCAHEYEKLKDMAAAAVAYKCTEVAYMRVLYSCHFGASRDWHKLQTALQILPPGESPCCASNYVSSPQVAGNHVISSPQVAGNHVISTENRPSLLRLLHFTQDVNYAMEASGKSRLVFAAANLRKVEAQYREGITSVKTALDFSFQDVEGLLHLVRLAMEAIGR